VAWLEFVFKLFTEPLIKSGDLWVALVENTETKEWRRHYNIENSIPPEHPQASTTDDRNASLTYLGTLLVKTLLCRR